MIFARIVLVLGSLMYLLLGLAFLFWPSAMIAKTGLATLGPAGVTEARATYGGLELALGVLLALAAVQPTTVPYGLIVMALTLGGFALGRLVGMLVDGVHENFTLIYFAIEAASALVAGAVFLFLKSRT